MAEEQKWQEPGGHSLCANNCGFFGSPTTFNLCSKCYKDHCLKEEQMKEAKLAMEKTSSSYLVSASLLSESDVSIGPGTEKQEPSSNAGQSEQRKSGSASEGQTSVQADERPVDVDVGNVATPPKVVVTGASKPNRCATCRKRVGLTGFNCRCGIAFCGSHRYPEQHGCTFDYKALGRDEIAKANPVVKAEKLDKI